MLDRERTTNTPLRLTGNKKQFFKVLNLTHNANVISVDNCTLGIIKEEDDPLNIYLLPNLVPKLEVVKLFKVINRC